MPPLYTEFIVPTGQMSEIALSDGTHVWLNSETTLRYADSFGKESRKVELSGEAFFKVNRNEIPFKVKIKGNEVEVLGTSFAAIAYPDEDFSRVTLVEGSVQINDNNGITLKQLAPNQQVNIPDDKNEEITTTEVNTTFYESLIKGEIRFDDELLSEVARRIERWYNVEIRFASTDMQAMRFTGTVLKEKPVDQSVAAICKLLALKADYKSNPDTKDVIIISKK
jgi:ferric-dicitrate binding protein FerR (iron transport regulator)